MPQEMQGALGAVSLAGPLLSGLTKGWRTSEGQLTSGAALLYTLGSAAEAMGYLPPGATAKLLPVVGLVAVYVLGRTGLKVARTKQAQQIEAIPAAQAPPAPASPLAGLPNALQDTIMQVGQRALIDLAQRMVPTQPAADSQAPAVQQ